MFAVFPGHATVKYAPYMAIPVAPGHDVCATPVPPPIGYWITALAAALPEQVAYAETEFTTPYALAHVVVADKAIPTVPPPIGYLITPLVALLPEREAYTKVESTVTPWALAHVVFADNTTSIGCTVIWIVKVCPLPAELADVMV